jgi:LacI family transcriptional regulator
MTTRRAATLTEVARRAGVSLTTASKAINGQNRVSADTRARVLKAARELSFTPNPMARSLISGRSGTVGLIVIDSLAQRFVAPIMVGAEAALSEIDLTMITSDARGDTGRLMTIVEKMRQRKVDGVIVLGDNNVPLPSVTAELDRPVVYVYGETGARDIVHVPDDREGGRLATEHLLSLGRDRLAVLTGPRGTRAVTERLKGIRAALRAGGASLATPVAYGGWSQRWGRTAAQRLLAEAPGVNGIVCGSDQIASGVVAAVADAGRLIPQDVAITGYDNWLIFAGETEPELTTVDMNLEALGAAAVRDLFGVIDGVPVGGGVRLHDCTLVVRGSTVVRSGEPLP